MKLLKNNPLTISLVAIAIIFLALALIYSASPNYGFSRSNQDGQSDYWKPSDGPCNEDLRNVKRPVRAINAVSLFYVATTLGTGTTSKDLDEVEQWKAQQGNCPYQVMDIYKTGIPIDLFLASLGYGAIGFALFKKNRSQKV